ncbi:MAG: hypothetical protein IJ492_03030 [Clostridia bacterium]|nr:hypothetical protein [Clostridia bacterium]
MYARAKQFLSLLKTGLIAIGCLCGIVGYGISRTTLHTLALALPFVGAFVGVGLAYVIYGIACACIYLSNAIFKRGGLAPHIQKKIVLSIFYFAMLIYFVVVCISEWESIRTYLSAIHSLPSFFSVVFTPCVYPFLALKGKGPFINNISLVQPLYITLFAFILFVVCLYVYSEWLQGGSATAYYEVSYNRESGQEVSRRAVSYGEVFTWQSIIGLLLLIFSLLTWPPITIIVLLVRMYGWDYLC